MMSGPQNSRTLGPYQIDTLIGSGPLGNVYRARSAAQPEAELAVKVLQSPLGQLHTVRDRFLVTSQYVTKLEHTHILPLEYAGSENNAVFSVSPYVQQGSLANVLARGRMAPKDIAPLFRQICEALIFFHNQGLVHGNIKPTNALIYQDRHILLSDFGLMWELKDIDPAHPIILPAMAAYIAPEQLNGYVDARADIYSVGVIIYQALTGQQPFVGSTVFETLSRIQRQPIPLLSQIQPPIAPGAMAFDDVLRKTLAKDPAARFQNAQSLLKALLEAGQLANEMPSRILPSVRPKSIPLSRANYPGAAPQIQQLPAPQQPFAQYPPAAPWSAPLPNRPPAAPNVSAQPPAQQRTPPPQMQQMRPPQQQQNPVQPPQQQHEMADFYTARHSSLPQNDQPNTDSLAHGQDTPDAEYSGSYQEDYPSVQVRSIKDNRGEDDEDSESQYLSGYHQSSRRNDNWDDSYTSQESSQRHWIEDDREDEYSREMSRAYPSRPRNYDDSRSKGYSDNSRKMPRYREYDPPADSARYAAAAHSESINALRKEIQQEPEAPVKKKNHTLTILSISIIIVLLFNMFLIVVYDPGICPKHSCDSLHSKIIQLIPALAPHSEILKPSNTGYIKEINAAQI